ncbi:unnamed protein product [Notodromas monacha]|uniref:CRAL-TRIO domain-containing protein n=1 Tax=Notodromas monacha TaxID=399045 RepID=A0A7R9BLE4_9CRUS|nr:unnamed protein product [Notodromas monacha]CAG0917635.1 unnamed protein product [Notodromas monacha]
MRVSLRNGGLVMGGLPEVASEFLAVFVSLAGLSSHSLPTVAAVAIAISFLFRPSPLFHRCQNQVIDLRSRNCHLEEVGKKQNAELVSLRNTVQSLQTNLDRAQASLNSKRRAKDLDQLLADNQRLQEKLQSQEDEFRMQNRTVLAELNAVCEQKEALEAQVDSATEEQARLRAENAALRDSRREHETRLDELTRLLTDAMAAPGVRPGAGGDDEEFVHVEGNEGEVRKAVEEVERRVRSWAGDWMKEKSALEDEKEALSGRLQTMEDEYRRRLGDMEERLDSYVLLQRERESELEVARRELDKLKARVAEADSGQTLQQVRVKLDEANKSFQEASAMKLVLEAQLGDVKTELEASRRECEAVRRDAGKLRERLQSCEAALAQLQLEAQERDARLQDATTMAEKRKALVDDMARAMQAQTDNVARDAQAMQDKVAQVQRDGDKRAKELLDELKPLRCELQSLRQQCSSLEQQLRDAESRHQEELAAEKRGAQVLIAEHELRVQELDGKLEAAKSGYETAVAELEQSLREAQLEAEASVEKAKMSEAETLRVAGLAADAEDQLRLAEKKHCGEEEAALSGEEVQSLLNRVAQLQQDKWSMEERLRTLEESAAGMTDALLQKSALIQFYCMEGRAEPIRSSWREDGVSGAKRQTLPHPQAHHHHHHQHSQQQQQRQYLHSSSSSSSSYSSSSNSGDASSGSGGKQKVRRIVDFLKSSSPAATLAHVSSLSAEDNQMRGVNKRMQRLVEETLTKNMHLQQNLEDLSNEVGGAMTDLPDWLVERAEAELFEKPSWRSRDVEALREMLKDEPGLDAQVEDKFLVKFLRARKFDYDRAFALVRHFYSLRAEHRAMFDFEQGFRPSSRVVELATKKLNLFEVLPASTTTTTTAGAIRGGGGGGGDGCDILICRIGNWDPQELSVDDLLLATLVILEYLSENCVTQVAGVAAIIDCRPSLGELEDGDSSSHASGGVSGSGSCMSWARLAKQITPAQAKKFVAFVQDHVPLRCKGIHIVGQPLFFSLVFNLFRPFLSDKNFSRVHLHGEDMRGMHSFLEPDGLPAEYGGNQGKLMDGDSGGARLNGTPTTLVESSMQLLAGNTLPSAPNVRKLLPSWKEKLLNRKFRNCSSPEIRVEKALSLRANRGRRDVVLLDTDRGVNLFSGDCSFRRL